MTRSAAAAFVACLEREGVETIFGLPGEELEDILFAIRDADISFVPVRHEQGAAFMADVHGRLTGSAGVCLATLGPGATNLMTGVADATLDKAPVVAITGQGGLERLHKESHQALDIVEMLAPITKWNAQISDPNIVHESVRKAFKVAEWEKPGATHLEFPEDIAARETDVEPLPTYEPVSRPAPDPTAIEQVRELLAGIDRALLISGNGAVRTGAAGPLRSLVATTDIPVASTYMGKGAISDEDPRSLMTLDSGDHEEASDAIERAELILAVGYDIAEHDPAEWNPKDDTRIVHIDTEPAEVYAHYNPDIEIVGDLSMTIRALADQCSEAGVCGDPEWYQSLREHIVEDVTQPPASAELTLEETVPYLRDAMASDDVLIADVGSHKMAIAQRFRTYEPNTCIISNGLAAMGIAVPGALAADLAVESNVVAVTGDGGFLMNAAEIETATRLGCSFTIVVFNDADYRLISEHQEEHRGDHFGTKFTNPDFMSFAESFGIAGYRPTSWGEIEAVLGETVSTDEMALVEIPLTTDW